MSMSRARVEIANACPIATAPSAHVAGQAAARSRSHVAEGLLTWAVCAAVLEVRMCMLKVKDPLRCHLLHGLQHNRATGSMAACPGLTFD